MNKLFSKIAALSVGLAMTIGVGVSTGERNSLLTVRASEVVEYTLNGSTSGTGSAYGGDNTASQGGVSWTVNGNVTTDPWRIGGNKNNGTGSNVDRFVYSGAAISTEDITKVVFTAGTVSITVNSFKLIVSTESKGAGTVIDELAGTITASSTTIFTKPSGHSWASKFFTFVFNVVNNTTTTKYVQFAKAEFYKESSAQLQSISLVTDTETVKTSYINGDSVSFVGIKAEGTYSDSSKQDLTSSCTISADKENVSLSDTSITYSATYNPGGFSITNLVLPISVQELAISSVEKTGNYRTSFVEKQKFSFGTGKVKVTWNNGTNRTFNPTDDGVTAKIGTRDITGVTHYLTMDDNEQMLTVAYGGYTVEVGTISVTEYVEPTSGYWSPVTSVSELNDGMEVIIVASEHEYAMGKYSTGNNVIAIDVSKDGEQKISSSIPGVQVYTLVESTAVANTFAFYDGTAYLAATGGTSSNYLKTESSISNNSSFAVTINDGVMSVVGQGSTASGARMTMRYNPGDIIFSCYGATSTTGSLACLYKFTAQEKSPDQIAVETYVKAYLHLDETDTTNYIDPNDNSAGTACLGPSGYYQAAKTGYSSLTADQKTIFATSSDVLIMWGRARLNAWAEANGEAFDAELGTFSLTVKNGLSIEESNTTMIIVIVVAATSAIALAALLVFKKKKHN